MIIGGAQENTLFSVEGLREYEDVEVVDLITGPSLGPEGNLLDLKGLKKGRDYIYVEQLVRNINPIKDIVAFYKLFKIFKEKKYDIVHTHSSKAGILGRIAAKAAGVKLVIHTIHGLPFHDYQNGIVNFIYILLEKIAALFSDKIVVVCDSMSKKALKKGIGKPELFETIYSGMDLDSFLNARKFRNEARKKFGFCENDIVIGKIARLFYLKGHEYLFDAFFQLSRKHGNIKLLLVGDGILREKYEKFVSEHGLEEKVFFAGLVPPDDIPFYLSAMDILVHVSLREGLARALPQAMACGIPVVSFDVDGARDIIENGENGYLVEPKDVDMLRDSIEILLADENFRKRMGDYGRLKVDPIFRKEYMVRKLYELYNFMLEGK